MAPGLWIDARDKVFAGEGRMTVKLASTITIADASGPELDQGALVRLLGEMVWFPTSEGWCILDGQPFPFAHFEFERLEHIGDPF